jgi:hypothetical protein
MLVHPLCCNDDRAGELGPTFHFMTRHDLVLANDNSILGLGGHHVDTKVDTKTITATTR